MTEAERVKENSRFLQFLYDYGLTDWELYDEAYYEYREIYGDVYVGEE